MITEERAKKLKEVLESNHDQKMYLFTLTQEEALVKINSLGYDFTLDEIAGYGSLLKSYISADGELDIDTLDNVSGGYESGKPGINW